MKLKRCTTCKETKPISNFCKNKNSPDGIDYYCHACILIRVKKYQAKDKSLSPDLEATTFRVCYGCNENKPLTGYYRKKAATLGRGYLCKTCCDAVDRKRRLANPLRYKQYARQGNLKRNFNISVEDYEMMLSEQKGVCKICGSSDPKSKHDVFHVDHDHKTGQIRGLLCHPCNVSLGGFDDNIEVMKKAIAYLEYNFSKNTRQLGGIQPL